MRLKSEARLAETKENYAKIFEAGSKAGVAFDGFIASDAFKKVAKWGKEEILAGRPVHTCSEH